MFPHDPNYDVPPRPENDMLPTDEEINEQEPEPEEDEDFEDEDFEDEDFEDEDFEDEDFEDEDFEPEDHMSDVEADADALRGIGWGTDEDYGYYGDGGDY